MIEKIIQGTWVEIEQVVLEPEERSANLPADTQKVPYVLRVSGFLEAEAAMGQVAAVRTIIGRRLEGKIIGVNPGYHHSFGETVPELLEIGREVQK